MMDIKVLGKFGSAGEASLFLLILYCLDLEHRQELLRGQAI